MAYELVSKSPSSAAVYILPNTIIYLKAINYFYVRLRQAYKSDLECKIGCKRLRIKYCTMAVEIRNYCVGN